MDDKKGRIVRRRSVLWVAAPVVCAGIGLLAGQDRAARPQGGGLFPVPGLHQADVGKVLGGDQPPFGSADALRTIAAVGYGLCEDRARMIEPALRRFGITPRTLALQASLRPGSALHGLATTPASPAAAVPGGSEELEKCRDGDHYKHPPGRPDRRRRVARQEEYPV